MTSRALLLAVVSALLASRAVRAQGSLTPPGPPAPTMLGLDQLGAKMDQANTRLTDVDSKAEKRTPIGAAPFTISAPGSYYLTSNLSVTSGDAITIAASGVTVDLNGFSITSSASPVAGSGIAINSNTLRGITIVNGSIVSGVVNNSGTFSGTGFVNGINVASSAGAILISRVAVSGVQGTAISAGAALDVLVEFCTVRTAGLSGIYAGSVRNSVAQECGFYGISATGNVSDCTGVSVGNGNGISAVLEVANSYGKSQTSVGLSAGDAINSRGMTVAGPAGLTATHMAMNCYGFNQGTGNVNGLNGSVVSNCTGDTNGTGYGIAAEVATNCKGSAAAGGHGVRFANLGSMCYGSAGANTAAVAGGGAVGPQTLP